MAREFGTPIKLPGDPTSPLHAATKDYVDKGRPNGQTVALTADVSTSGTAYVDVPGLSFPVSPNTRYVFDFHLYLTSAIATTAPRLALNGPASPTALRYAVEQVTTSTASHNSSQTAYDTNTNPNTGPGATAQPCRIHGVIEVGATGGTVVLRLSSEIAASAVTVLRGSWVWWSAIGVSADLTAPVATLTDGATINTDAAIARHFRVTLGGNRTLAAPTNAADGMRRVWELIQDGSSLRTITLASGAGGFQLGGGVANVTPTGGAAGKRAFLGAIYSSDSQRWHVLAFDPGL